MNTREIDPWYIIFYDSLPIISEDWISPSRPPFYYHSYHNAFNYIRYILHSYAKLGNFRHSYKPPFTIAQEVERLHADALAVVGVDIYEKSPTAIRFLMSFLPGLGWKIDPTTITFKSQLDNWLKEHKGELNPNFLDNLEKAIADEKLQLEAKSYAEYHDKLEAIVTKIKTNSKELPLQDQISFLSRECENLMKYYETIIHKMLKKNKKVFEACKQDSTTLKPTDEIIDGLAISNPLLKNYIKKNVKDLGEAIEKYKLIRNQYNTLHGQESRQDKLQMYSNQFKNSEKIIKKHRDSKLMRFAKICLFSLANILSLGLINFMINTYDPLFKPRGKAYTGKIRGLGLIEPDDVETTANKKNKR